MTKATTAYPARSPTTRNGRALFLSGLLALQAACMIFLIVDVIADFTGWDLLDDGTLHLSVELVAVVGLTFGVVMTGIEIRRIRRRQRRVEAQLRAASGAFLDLLEEHFESWSLTPSERDVALLMIKGLSIAEIAALRHTRDGTVKAQCNAIYSKAGVSGRPQLLSMFIDDLMSGELVPPSAPAPAASRA